MTGLASQNLRKTRWRGLFPAAFIARSFACGQSRGLAGSLVKESVLTDVESICGGGYLRLLFEDLPLTCVAHRRASRQRNQAVAR